MARIVREQESLELVLTPRERLLAFHRAPVTAAVDAVRRVRQVPDAWAELRGWRAPGTGLPRVVMIGTTHSHGERDFCVVLGQKPGLVVEFDPDRSEFARWVVSDVDAIEGWDALPG